jgi:hypothetical protein
MEPSSEASNKRDNKNNEVQDEVKYFEFNSFVRYFTFRFLLIERCDLILLGCKQEPNAHNLFCVPAMVNVMCIDSSLQVFTFSFYFATIIAD